MGVISQIRGRDTSRIANDVPDDGAAPHADPEKDATGEITDTNSSRLSLDERNEKEIVEHGNQVTSDAQLGVQKAEAAALVWSKTAVRLTYAWVWVGFFMLALQQSILYNAGYLAYNDFSAAPQIAQAGILANIIGGVLRLPIAKVLNLWGRAEGFLVFIVVYILGMVIIASSTGPDSYAAGYTIYWIGYDAIYFIMDVFIADTSGLRNRAFAWAFASTPFICTAFTGPLAAQSFLLTSGWRWAIGAFCIIQLFVYVPLVVIFKFYQIKAAKQGLFVREPSGRTTTQSIMHYFHEFDVIGAFLLMGAFVLFLLPFSMNSYGLAGYNTPTFIVMVVFGVLLFPAFAVWEGYFAPVQFIRWELFKKRTVLGACSLAAILYFSFYSWDLYYYNFVMVVYNLDISKTGYMTQIYNVGSCFWGVVFGVFIRYTKHFKWACFCFGLPLMFLGAGLMIHFRGDDQPIGYIVMAQIFIAFAGGTLVIGENMAVMAAADRDGVPMMLAILGMFANLGGAIGYAVSGAIYTSTFPQALEAALPAETKSQAATIYLSGYSSQLLYPPGNATRTAINYAWGYSQKQGCISATSILVLAIPAILIWKNYNVDKRQNKGVLI
ncbi:MFS general substrate transporter [Thozetella sp. PMI_491]|nr:MFS general substrate transporter [Thozetella sp. PMI_491]